MQHGPETPSNSTPQSQEPVSDAQERDLSSANPSTTQEPASESFFETWAKGQDMPMGPSMLFLAGVILAFIVIMRSLIKSSAKRKLQTHTMGDTSQRIEKIKNHAKGSMDPARQAMVDAENLTRRMGAGWTTKPPKSKSYCKKPMNGSLNLNMPQLGLLILNQYKRPYPTQASHPKPSTEHGSIKTVKIGNGLMKNAPPKQNPKNPSSE